MITLKNIRKEGNKIFADCYPEGEKKAIKVSITENNFDSFTFAPSSAKEEWRQHLTHARSSLIAIAEGRMGLEDGVIMWY